MPFDEKTKNEDYQYFSNMEDDQIDPLIEEYRNFLNIETAKIALDEDDDQSFIIVEDVQDTPEVNVNIAEHFSAVDDTKTAPDLDDTKSVPAEEKAETVTKDAPEAPDAEDAKLPVKDKVKGKGKKTETASTEEKETETTSAQEDVENSTVGDDIRAVQVQEPKRARRVKIASNRRNRNPNERRVTPPAGRNVTINKYITINTDGGKNTLSEHDLQNLSKRALIASILGLTDGGGNKVADVDSEATVNEPESSKELPWFSIGALAVLCVAALITGIYYWYTTYYDSGEEDVPAFFEPLPPADEYLLPPVGLQDTNNDDDISEEYEPEDIRPLVDPSPEFLALWEEYDRTDIVARLTIAEEDVLIIQVIDADYDTEGWAVLDEQVNLLFGEDDNMVIFAAEDSYLQQMLREYSDYDHFLMHPTLLLDTLYGYFEWEIFAFFVAPAALGFMEVNYEDPDAWGDMVGQFIQTSLYNTRLDVAEYDQIITIVSPAEGSPDLFTVLQARMLRQITS